MMKTNAKRKNSAVKKLIPAAGMLALSASMLATSTYAWFTMNTEVSVTGMSLTTRVDSNLLIDDVAPCHGGTGSWSAGSYATNDSTFKSSTTQTIGSAILAPISTVNAYNFFATAPNNVQGNGNATTDAYTAITNLSSLTTLGYTSATDTWLDYHFVLKATNTNASGGNSQNINLSKLKLTYSGATDDENAFRVAVLSKKFETATVDGAKTLPGIDASSTGVTTHIYKAAAATNFDTNSETSNLKAVNATNGLGDVTYASAAADSTIGTVTAGETAYYEVIVRVWLEGEDTTCTVNKFKDLTSGSWNLETNFKLEEGTASGVYVIEKAVTT